MKQIAIAAWLLLLLAGPVANAADVPHVSGGIGEDEQKSLQAREGEFNLKLVFTLLEGNYLADVSVTVTDAANRKIIEHRATGPFFMAKLPAGQYRIEASHEGKTVARKVSVGARGLRTEYLRWASNPATDFPLPREQAGKSGTAASATGGSS